MNKPPEHITALANTFEAHQCKLDDAEWDRDQIKWLFDRLENEGWTLFIEECVRYGMEKLPRKDAA